MQRKFIDIHTHYSYKDYNKLKQALTKDIVGVCSTVDIDSYYDLEKLRQKNLPNLYFTYGLYPDVVINKPIDECFDDLKKIDFSKALAIGEIGLDNKITKDKQKRLLQRKLFEKQLEIADKQKLPVIVHSRFATKHVLEALTTFNGNVVLHWFSGTDKEIDEALSRNYYLTINYDRTKINITTENVDNMFIETDYPIPYNNKTDILNIKEAYKIVANKNKLDVNYLQKKIEDNFYRLFKLKL